MKNNRQLYLLIILVGVVLLVHPLSSCQTQTSQNTTPPTPTSPSSEPFRIIAYVTSAVIVDIVPFERLTHINYAFLIPRSDGSLDFFPNAWKLDLLVERAHEHGVKVLISVGGWGYDEQFENLASTQGSRDRFVEGVTQFSADHHLDGVDIDWEYPDQASAQNFLALITDLRTALPQDNLLTAAVVALGENSTGIHPESYEVMDFLNIMAYDGPPEQHASMSYAQNALDFWLNQGLPAQKAVLGVPFYGHPNGVAYKDIVISDLCAAYLDQVEYQSGLVFYNGIPTVQEKTKLAMERGGGIMFWTLEQDTLDDTSLLKAIFDVVGGEISLPDCFENCPRRNN